MSVFLQPLQTVTVGSGGSGGVNFTNIPQTYTDLVIKASVAVTSNGFIPDLFMSFNNNISTTLYSDTILLGTGSATGSNNNANNNVARVGLVNYPTYTSNTFASVDIYIPNYTGSNYKSIISDSVTENNGTTSYPRISANLWRSTAAINEVDFLTDGGVSFIQYSKFSLYGVLRQGI